MRKTSEMMEGTHKRQRVEPSEKVGQCVECRQPGELNHRGVCDHCDDPYGKSALASLLEKEISRGASVIDAMQEYKGLSDFFRNASEEVRRKVLEEVARRATEEQQKLLRGANE